MKHPTTESRDEVITDEEVQAAESAAAVAKVALVAAERAAAREPQLSAETAGRYGVAMTRANAATARAARLRETQATQVAELAARRKAEKAAGKDLDGLAQALDSSQRDLVAAVTAAERALVQAVTAAQAHDALIGRSRDHLVDLGLLESSSGVAHDTAAGGARAGLRLRGVQWWPVDPGTVLARIAANVARSVLPRRLRGRFTAATPALAGQRLEALLTGVPVLPELVEPQRGWVWPRPDFNTSPRLPEHQRREIERQRAAEQQRVDQAHERMMSDLLASK